MCSFLLSQHKILIIAPSWIGDAVMSLSLIQVLKRQRPQSLIHVLAAPWCRPIYQVCPDVAQTMVMPVGHGQLDLLTRWRLAKELKQEGYSEAYILPNSWKSALIPFLARIPKRIGYWGEGRIGLLTHGFKRQPHLKFLVQQYQYLAGEDSASIKPRLFLSPSPEEREKLRQQWGIQEEEAIIALCPGAEYGPAKRWPTDYFAHVIDHYGHRGWQCVILGSGKDQPVAEEICQKATMTAINLTGKTSLVEAMEVLSLARVVVTNDSGLMHVAAALDRPVVAIFGSSSPAYTPPLSSKARIVYQGVPCSPCFKRECPLKGDAHLHCLTTIKPEHIYQVIESMEK